MPRWWTEFVRGLARRHHLSTWVYLASALYVRAGTQAGTLPSSGLIAHYPLLSDGHEASGKAPTADLKNVEFRIEGCYLNGGYEHGPENGYRTLFPVGALSYDSLGFSVDLLPLDFRPTPNRRPWSPGMESLLSLFRINHHGSDSSHENVITCGPSYRWLSVKSRSGQLELWLNNGTTQLAIPGAIVEPDQWHRLVVSLDLKAGTILTSLDGRQLPAVNLPQPFALNVVGSPAEKTDKALTFTDYSNGSVFHGYAADLRVYDHALTRETLEILAHDRGWEMRPLPVSPRYPVRPLVMALTVGVVLIIWLLRVRVRRRGRGSSL